jgi:hypothetical protein
MTEKSREYRSTLMRAEYEINFDDFVEAQATHSQARPWLWALALSLWADCFLIAPLPLVQRPFFNWLKTLNGNPIQSPLFFILCVPLLLIFLWTTRKSTKPWNRFPANPVRKKLSRIRDNGILSAVLLFTTFLIVIRFQFEMEDSPPNGYSLTGRPLGGPSIGFGLQEMAIPLFTVGLALFYLLVPAFPKLNFRRAWNRQKTSFKPVEFEPSEEQCVVTSAMTRSEISWDAFPGYIESPNLFLLYSSPTHFFIIPKRSFSTERNQGDFRQLLRRRVSERHAAFPVVLKDQESSPPH